jgi:hypothetical protein
MKHSGYQAFAILLFFFFIPSAASAWGTLGHRIIGEMSENLLSEIAKARITPILSNASIAMISNWGDEVRSDSAYDYTADWHYTNLDAGLKRVAFDMQALKRDNGQNIYSVLALTNHLKQAPGDTIMLKMLIHLVGDMHCPLHLGHADDKGGNSIKISWFGVESNLHRLWDSELIDRQKLSYTEYTTHLMRVNELQIIPFDGSVNTILDWAWETYISAQTVYASAEEVGKPYEYVYHYKYLWENNLIKAAEHLASLLNYIYQ